MQLSAINEWLSSSNAELRLHRLSCLAHGELDKTRAEIRIGATSDDTVTVQLWWVGVPSLVAHEFLWDDCEVLASDPKAVVSELDIERLGLSVGSATPKVISRPSVTNVPMFEFHPQRFRSLHPLGKEMASSSHNEIGFTHSTMQRAANSLMAAQRTATQETPLRNQISHDSRKQFNDVVQLAMFFSDFYAAGKQIFSFPPALSAMFRRTDVNDIPLDALQMPYRTIYLSFGAQADLTTPDGWLVDGAYVSMLGDNEVMQFALTFSPQEHSHYARWAEYVEPVYIQAMNSQMMKIGVGEAADQVLSNKVAELRKQITTPKELAKSEGIRDISAENASAELERITELHKVWSEALKLVINALAYLGSYPDDISSKWPDKTPQRLYLQTQDGTDKQRRTAVSKLAALGYTPIHLCGKQFNEQVTETSTRSTDHVANKPTWVRGHWVRQPYGPGRTLRKLQWRMPLLRNANVSETEEPMAHLYLVS